MGTGEVLSVIMPSRREGPRLLESIRAARMAIGGGEFVVVAHGESADTRDCARAEGVTWVDAPRANRGLQLELGAERARGRQLVFLHADSRLPIDAGRLIREALAADGVAGGAFRLRFDRRHPVLGLLTWLSALTLPTAFLGDQCLFCTRSAYDSAGGFRPEPLFEDVDLAERLARVGRLVRLRPAVTTSARRFMSNGPFRQLVTNALLMLAYHAGVSPARLSGVYEFAGSAAPARVPARGGRCARAAGRPRARGRRLPRSAP
jgi:rSAM/selenodomain-associated transferase 2